MTPDKLPVPSEVAAIATRLENAGFETWCVGGAVRDYLLGFPNNDVDLATAATPQDVRRLFRRTVAVGESHGTMAVLDRKNVAHEVTTFRRDVETDGRHAVVQFGASLDEDLSRRDFTINAIAYHPLRSEWRDPHAGRADIERRLIRAVGDAEARFREDYLRILRAFRFAARFDFTIEERTWHAAKANVAGLRGLSAERVRDEWFKGLVTARSAERFVTLWDDVGACAIWLPEVVAVPDRGRTRIGSLERFAERDPVIMTCYLSNSPVRTLKRLKVPTVALKRAAAIERFRDAYPGANSPVEIRKWLSQVGDAADDLLSIHAVEGREAVLRETARAIRNSGAPLSVSDLAIDGSDLIALGVPEGPQLGHVLHRLLGAVLEDPELNHRERLLQIARTHEFKG